MLTKLIKIRGYNGTDLNFPGINRELTIRFVKKKKPEKEYHFQKVARIQTDHLSSLVMAKLKSLV